MIPHEARNQFNEIISHEMFEMDRSLAGTTGATQSQAAARGMGVSGPVMRSLKNDAVNSLKARSHFILGQLLRCLTAHRVPLTDENLIEAATLLRETIEAQGQIVRTRLFSLGAFNVQSGVNHARQQLQAELDQEAPRIIRRLTMELKLTAAASNAASESPQRGHTYNFSGPVALVQTGDGSQATVTQHLDSGSLNEVSRALNDLLEQLDREQTADVPRRDELRQLAIEAKTEAEKPEPNTLKLGSSLRTIAETTKFVGSLGPAYQVIKPLLSYFGIHMP